MKNRVKYFRFDGVGLEIVIFNSCHKCWIRFRSVCWEGHPINLSVFCWKLFIVGSVLYKLPRRVHLFQRSSDQSAYTLSSVFGWLKLHMWFDQGSCWNHLWTIRFAIVDTVTSSYLLWMIIKLVRSGMFSQLKNFL